MAVDLAEQILTDPELAQMIETEEKARRVWHHYPKLQQEFREFNTFWGYLIGLKQNGINVCRGNGVTQNRMPA